uniref:Methyl-accepting chemotaxis protein n=1 Tax=Candidatus Kentrum sp. FW TaxID=2126338 RepID=A0A450U1S4_9GAMM|nr:MAG: hypothetical protein BECKFW1821C_GA0114237_11062 [Candidatus Kentron sp. FW]
MSINPEKGNSTSSQRTTGSSTGTAPGRSTPGRSARRGEAHLEHFAKTFEASARRWEMIVYPSMLAFIVVAVYGFYLVYSLTRDMHTLSNSMDPDMQPHMDTLADSVSSLSGSIDVMTRQVEKMTQSVLSMDKTMVAINGNMSFMREDMSRMTGSMNNMEPMLVNLAEMNVAMHRMNESIVSISMSITKMSHDVGAASHQFVRPMSVLNSFAPW